MTNLEYYKDEINEYIEKNRDIYVYDAIANGFKKFSKKYINNYPNNPLKFIDWLLQEHKEPIKLKQWEYDLIRTNDMSHNRTFDSFNTYKAMKRCGYFKGIEDTSMTIEEILENCEVVE